MNEEFRKVAPAPLEAIPFNVPKPFLTTLENGLKIVIVEDKRHPFISFRLAFPKGDINDPENGIGVTSAMASMLTEGTENYSSKELALEIENLGASLSVGAGLDNTIVKANTLSAYRKEIIKLMTELVLLPVFPEKELDLYKRNSIEGLKYQRSQPDFLADEQVARLIYGEHPYGINSPSKEDLEKITRDQLISQHRRIFIPNNAILIVVGDIEIDVLLKEIKEGFQQWAPGEIENQDFPAFPEREKRTITIVDRPGSTQSNIVLANPGIKRNHPDYFSVLVMNQILGAGASSRLFMNLREEKGYTYGAYSRIYSKRHGGSFEATSEVRTNVTADSLKEFFYELNRMREEKATIEELNDAKNYLTGVFPIRAETQTGLTGLIVSKLLYELPEDYLETYRENVDRVTLEDVHSAAQKYIFPEKMALVVVGDAEDVLPQVKSYSDEIDIFDTNNNPLDIKKYLTDPAAEVVNVSGEWNLAVEAMGQTLEITMKINQEGQGISGEISSMLGNGSIQDGKVVGNKISAKAKTEFQGQEVELGIKGTVSGDSIEGNLNAPMIPVPLEFKGTRT
jgi:zinc protease